MVKKPVARLPQIRSLPMQTFQNFQVESLVNCPMFRNKPNRRLLSHRKKSKLFSCLISLDDLSWGEANLNSSTGLIVALIQDRKHSIRFRHICDSTRFAEMFSGMLVVLAAKSGTKKALSPKKLVRF
ncbi:hypothetical protein TNIN_422411 [Trichonephila inaurata madagascariensis]|uniref:Uncharacterized protein n=1 Tax=Trichonephila inaurata madagascariensis TaxID=2747483 RepID=A0A8X7CJ16_9ARAC|nr:hypothetical protein TNIN_422411 [Trichonephila inaurata madagascariensis]